MTSSDSRHAAQPGRARHALLVVCVLALAPSAALAQVTLINNGLAPPNPANVISSDVTELVVRNAGCGTPAEPYAACASPGASTEVVVEANVTYRAEAGDTSTLEIDAGTLTVAEANARQASTLIVSSGKVTTLYGYDDAFVHVAGGNVELSSALGSSTMLVEDGEHVSTSITSGMGAGESGTLIIEGGVIDLARIGSGSLIEIRGGQLDTGLLSEGTGAVIEIYGFDFEVDGVPVGYGPVSGFSGDITGVLESAELIDVHYLRGVFFPPGDIVLMETPEPTRATLFGAGAALLVWLSRRRARR